METKVKTLCRIRDLYRSIAEFENCFHSKYQLTLNEGMLMCVLKTEGELTAGALAEKLGLSFSNTSKVIASVEKKGFLERKLGNTDKRQMHFCLTGEGHEMMDSISCCDIEIPEMLRKIL